MDSFDIKILNIVQQDNRASTEKIADEIGLSPSAVQRRLKHLRETGVIEADVSIVSNEAVGKKLLVIVNVTLGREVQAAIGIEEFKKVMVDAPEVIQCLLITGASDFILMIAITDMTEYENFTYKYFLKNPNITGFKTSIVINKVKYGLAIPLSADNFE